MTAYYLFGQCLRPVFSLAYYLYNSITHRERSRVVVVNEHGEYLLVRNWGGTRRWGLSGGGVERGEQAVEAARRELQEEVGIDRPVEDFHYLTTIEGTYPAPIYVVRVARAELPDQPVNPWEITHLDWFKADNLPPLSGLTQEIMAIMAVKP
jgi:8-oxo-dGTP pyrophosphatase MutT (NUDIX family)